MKISDMMQAEFDKTAARASNDMKVCPQCEGDSADDTALGDCDTCNGLGVIPRATAQRVIPRATAHDLSKFGLGVIPRATAQRVIPRATAHDLSKFGLGVIPRVTFASVAALSLDELADELQPGDDPVLRGFCRNCDEKLTTERDTARRECARCFAEAGEGDSDEDSEAARIEELTDEHGAAFIAWYENESGRDFDSLEEDFQEAYAGTYRNIEDWAEDFLTETGHFAGVPDSVRNYFDYSAWANDAELGGDIWTEQGGEGVFVFWNR